VTIGVPVGLFLAALVFGESGSVLGALVAFVVLSVFYGAVMARRMSRFWPVARDLSADDRVAVVRRTRRGSFRGDARLAQAVIAYTGGLREAHAQARKYRWVVWLCAAAVLVLAVVDSVVGPFRVALVSWLFVGFFVIELSWWPRRQDQLLANAQLAERSARRVVDQPS
jgi:Flp pilus assembly protein TadB